jgi:hypothetical protein
VSWRLKLAGRRSEGVSMRLRLAVNEVACNLIATICNESAGLSVAPGGRRGPVGVAEAGVFFEESILQSGVDQLDVVLPELVIARHHTEAICTRAGNDQTIERVAVMSRQLTQRLHVLERDR